MKVVVTFKKSLFTTSVSIIYEQPSYITMSNLLEKKLYVPYVDEPIGSLF